MVDCECQAGFGKSHGNRSTKHSWPTHNAEGFHGLVLQKAITSQTKEEERTKKPQTEPENK